MIEISNIDSYISQHGQFCLLDWLLAENLITYTNYEAWRYGDIEYLDERISLSAEELTKLMSQSYSNCTKLKLDSEPQVYYQWAGEYQKQLSISNNRGIDNALAASWISSKDAPQMDLFMDNTATIVENQVVDRLANRDFQLAEKALQQLSELNSAHKKLGGYRDLINYGLHITATATIAQEALCAEFDGVNNEVAPLAKELLGAKQRDYLAFAWRRVSDSYAKNINAGWTDENNQYTYALLQIPDWSTLQEYLEQDEGLYQSVGLMERLTQVYLHTRQIPLFVLMWGLLFERYPQDAESMLGISGTILVKHWDDFLAFSDDWPDKYFLGYLLIQQPGLVHSLAKLPQQNGSCLKLPVNQWVLGLVKARLNDENEKHYREHLKRECPAMLDCYLNKRDWQVSIRKGSVGFHA